MSARAAAGAARRWCRRRCWRGEGSSLFPQQTLVAAAAAAPGVSSFSSSSRAHDDDDNNENINKSEAPSSSTYSEHLADSGYMRMWREEQERREAVWEEVQEERQEHRAREDAEWERMRAQWARSIPAGGDNEKEEEGEEEEKEEEKDKEAAPGGRSRDTAYREGNTWGSSGSSSS
mmetsp:Transcript_4714/g.11907  ORF Transcript_4714/g.11907 Transcript_4714/m.11907 type:complete len:176 (+) Transcript_4714:191-718(+)